EFKKVLQKSNDTIKNFNTLNRQYINIFNRSVEQETNLGSADSLLLAVDNAKPFMDATQIERLMADSEQMMSATATTIKLANSTFDNYQTNGGSPDQLTNTIKELERMVSVLSANRDECTGIENAISPLLGRGQILDTAKETNEQLTTNATLFNDIYIQGRNTLKENSLLVRKAVKLKAEQDTILGESKRSLSYFYRHGTPQTTSDLEIAFRQTLQYKIDDYDLKKLNSGHKTISIKFQDWRQIATVQKDYPPETINTIYNAETILPAITKLKEVLTEKIKIAKETIEKFNAPVKPDSIASTVRNDSSQTSTIQDKEFLTSTLKDIIKKITPSTRQDSQSPQSMHGYSICGFTFFKNNIEQARAIGNNPDSKPIPLFYDGYRKLLEKGTINIWYDNNGNNIRDIGEEKQEPYWIWYHSKFYITGSWFLWGDEEQTNSRFKDYAKSMSEQSQFSNKNIAMGVTGLSTRRDKTIVGNVYTTPFNLNARISVRAQVGKNTYFESAADNSSEYYEKYRSNVLEKISFWETGRKEQLRNTMTCLMELPKEYVTLTEKYFYKNIQELSPEIQLGGFEIVRQKESERTFSKEFRRKTPLENSNTKKNIVYSIHMKILKADLNDAWNTVLKDGDKRILANGSSSDHPWAMQVTGADITNATRVAKKTKHTKRTTTKKRISVPDFYVKERIFIRKANVFVRVLGSGSHMESPELETKQIAESILAKFFKENL
ncbi:hypothetical protein KAJ27_18850, partial [bacterium]|nr:hypothetical protein [bacterium]